MIKRKLIAILLAFLMLISHLVSFEKVNAWVAPETRDSADGNVTEYISPSTTSNGVQGVYLGNWENITENSVMLLGNPTFRQASDNGIVIEDPSGILNQVNAVVTHNYLAASGGNAAYNPLVVTVPNDSEWTTPIAATATYTETNVDGTTSTYQGKEISLSGAKATLTWENAAVLKDGTLCDLVMEISNITVRLNPGTTYVAGDQFVFLSGGNNKTEGDGNLSAYARFVPSSDRNTDITGFGDNKWTPGIGFDITMKVKPVDGSTCADHDADTMIYYFTDLDASDASITKKNTEDVSLNQTKFKGAYAESIQMASGVNGPIIILNKTYNDLSTGSGSNLSTSTNVLYLENASTPNLNGRLFNEDRMRHSKGTWFSASHNTYGAPDTEMSGFVTSVNPDSFTYRWRGNNCGSSLIAQAKFEPRLRVVNENRYRNVLTTIDEDVDPNTAYGEAGFHRTLDVARYNPTYVVPDKGPKDAAPEQSTSVTSSIAHRYYVGWKTSKVIRVKSEPGYHLEQFILADGVAVSASPEKNNEKVDVKSMAIGEKKYFAGNHSDAYVEKISDNEALVYLNESYTDLDGTTKYGYLTDHTLRVSAAPDILTINKRWIGDSEKTDLKLEIWRLNNGNAFGSEELVTTIDVTKDLVDNGTKIPGTDIPYVVDNGDNTWSINYPVVHANGQTGYIWPELPQTYYNSITDSASYIGAESVYGYNYHAKEVSVEGTNWQLAGSQDGENGKAGYTNTNNWRASANNSGTFFYAIDSEASSDNLVTFGTYGDDKLTGGYINNIEVNDVIFNKVWKDNGNLTDDEKEALLKNNLVLNAEYEDVTDEFQLQLEKDRLNGGTGVADTDSLKEVLSNEYVTGEPDFTKQPTINKTTWEITYENMPKYRISWKNNVGNGESNLNVISDTPYWANILNTVYKVEKINYYLTENKLNGFEEATYTNVDDTKTTVDESKVTDKAFKDGTINNVQDVIIQATKVWDDNNDAKGLRDDVIFHLDSNKGKDVLPAQKISKDATTLSVVWGNNTAYTSASGSPVEANDNHLPLYDEDGNEITYSVREEALNGYATTVSDFEVINTNDTTKVETKNADVTNKLNPPKATPMVTKDGQYDDSDQDGNTLKTQSATPNFELGTETLADGTPNSFTYTLVDENGNDVTEVNVPGEGTYVIDPETGTITFTPEEGFTGVATGVTVKGTDKLGLSAETTYTPIVVPNKQVETLKRTVEYTYWDEEGNEVTEMVEEEYTFTRVGTYDPSKDDDPEGYNNDPDDKDDQTTINYPNWTAQNTSSIPNPTKEGWTPDKTVDGINGLTPDKAEELGFEKDAEGNYVKKENVIYTPEPPVGKDKNTYGEVGQPQSTDAKKLFDVTTPTTDTGETNKIEKVQLIDPDTGEATDGPVKAYDVNGNECGTFVIDPETGMVTFTPKEGYEGVPEVKPVTLIATDSNGLTATAKYTPHVKIIEETVSYERTIDYKYDDGTPVLDDEGNPLSVTQTVTFTRNAKKDPNTGELMIDPETGDVIWDEWEPDITSVDSVTSPDVDQWYTEDKVVDGVDGITVDNAEDKLKNITVIYHKPPKADEKITFGGKGDTQKGTPPFEEGSGKLTDYALIDPKTGEATDTITIPGQGTYTIDPKTGEVTFVPEPDFVGEATTVVVRGTDENGNSADGEYTPIVIDNEETVTKTHTIEYKYEDGTKAADPVTRNYIFNRTGKVNPETGEIVWENWIKETLQEVESPEIEGYTPDQSSIDEKVGDPHNWPEDDVVVYTKDTYTVTFLDGSNGKNTGGNESGKPYGSYPEGGNEITPDEGYKFTGKYTYTITKKDGTVITGETDDPTSVEVVGDIVFTPVYEPKTYWVTYVDPDGTTIYLEKTTQQVGKDEPEAPKDPTKDGYIFKGWDREVDEDGNVTYTAKWEPKTYWVTYVDPDGTTVYLEKTTQQVGKDEPEAPKDPTKDGYTFKGWDREVDEDGNVTYTAKWEEVKTYWVIYVDPATGRIIKEQTTQPVGDAEPKAPNDPEREGYEFKGWSRTVDRDGNVTYEAIWEPKVYWVTYVDPDGTTIYLEKTYQQVGNDEPVGPNDPTKDGYNFKGWDREVDEDGNVTYIAKWEPNTYWVTYIDPDGTTIYLEKTTQEIGADEPVAPKDPTKEGFVFKGWDRYVDELGNVTYIAKWKELVKPNTSTRNNMNTYGSIFTVSLLGIGYIVSRKKKETE